MSSLIKGLALFVAVSCGVWISVLWRWQSTAHGPSMREAIVHLGVLPLVVFGLVLLLRGAWRGAQARQAVTAASGCSAATPCVAAAGIDDAQRRARLQLIAAPLVCAAGTSAAQVGAAAEQGAPLSLDPTLRDADGLPVLTARIADLDTDAMAPMLESLLVATRARGEEWAGASPRDHALRALAALQEPLSQAVTALVPWADRLASKDEAGQAPRAHLLIGWPQDWTSFEQALGREFVAALVDNERAQVPAAVFAITSQAGTGEALLLEADRRLQALGREQRDEPLIVAACDSAIGEDRLHALEQAGVLFASRKRPKGRIPGEAAAALVLAPAHWPAAPNDGTPPTLLHRPAVLQRTRSVDAGGRIDSDELLQAMTHAAAASGLDHDAIGSLACDADQHTARGPELHGAALRLLPHLDSGEDLRLIGAVTGAVGAVSALLVVACAAESARQRDKPCLAVTVGDPFARLALIALPASPQASDAASAAAPGSAG
jgi:hypothetical protein